jgi:hypothetical protein
VHDAYIFRKDLDPVRDVDGQIKPEWKVFAAVIQDVSGAYQQRGNYAE